MGSHYVAQAGLKLSTLPSAGIIGRCHYTTWLCCLLLSSLASSLRAAVGSSKRENNGQCQELGTSAPTVLQRQYKSLNPSFPLNLSMVL
jgi:hypothetical protein